VADEERGDPEDTMATFVIGFLVMLLGVAGLTVGLSTRGAARREGPGCGGCKGEREDRRGGA
jgi:hypothetical protein